MVDEETKKSILGFQRNELTEHFIYGKLSRITKGTHNKEVLSRISSEELGHCHLWRQYTQADPKPDRWSIWKYFLISRILGLTFGIKLMERGEAKAQVAYDKVAEFVPEATRIGEEENEHERQLIGLIDEERLRYVGSVVLGLNDALVELTGALAGFTFAFQNARLVALAGLITGIAASFSMAASEYLSTRSEEDGKNPLRASVYTGCAYVVTVALLVFPFFVTARVYVSLGITILNAIVVIFFFTFYISVAKDLSFKQRFFEMAAVSLGIAGLTFVIGCLVRTWLGVET